MVNADLDYIIVYSNRAEKMWKHMPIVLEVLFQARFSLKLFKCNLSTQKSKFLGLIITKVNAGIDEDLIAIMIVLSMPECYTNLMVNL